MSTLLALFPKARKVNARLRIAHCPFHEDKHASLRLTLYKGRWRFKCFPCDISGDALDMLMKRDKMTFRQALDVCGLKEPPLPYVDIWERKFWRLLVCDACRDERVEVRDVAHLNELADEGRTLGDHWEIASDGIAAVGPKCLAKHEQRSVA